MIIGLANKIRVNKHYNVMNILLNRHERTHAKTLQSSIHHFTIETELSATLSVIDLCLIINIGITRFNNILYQ